MRRRHFLGATALAAALPLLPSRPGVRKQHGFTTLAAGDEFTYPATGWGQCQDVMPAWDAKTYRNWAGWENVQLTGTALQIQCSWDADTGIAAGGFLEGTRLGHFTPPYYVEVRAQCPAVYGFWPAPGWTWSWPYGSVGGVEVDFCELLGRMPDSAPQTVHGMTSAVDKTAPVPAPGISGWHVYSAAVWPDRVCFYIDGTLTNTTYNSEIAGGVDRSDPADLCTSLTAGGGPWAGTPTGSSTQVMTVDYIRAWV